MLLAFRSSFLGFRLLLVTATDSLFSLFSSEAARLAGVEVGAFELTFAGGLEAPALDASFRVVFAGEGLGLGGFCWELASEAESWLGFFGVAVAGGFDSRWERLAGFESPLGVGDSCGAASSGTGWLFDFDACEFPGFGR